MATDISGYWTTAQVCARLEISRMTLYRYSQREHNPFPKARMVIGGKRFAKEDVIAWESREHQSQAA